jgi:hypothetical protein
MIWVFFFLSKVILVSTAIFPSPSPYLFKWISMSVNGQSTVRDWLRVAGCDYDRHHSVTRTAVDVFGMLPPAVTLRLWGGTAEGYAHSAHVHGRRRGCAESA